jgi:FtsH-binding integral membrane protein
MEALRHFWDRPYMAIALVILAFGVLNLVHALAPRRSRRHRVLSVVAWVMYLPEVLVLFSGRKARKDKGTHLIYALCVLSVGLLLFLAALVA